MGLLAPIFLLALPLLAAIIVLYLLKLRRPIAPIASLHLWDTLTRDREANSLWQRLRVSMLLILQLLVLLALIVALARPWVASEETTKQSAIIIVDVSASMGANDADERGFRTRLQAAQEKAKDIIDDLPQGGTATLIASDDHASVIVPTTDDKARLRRAVDGLQPSASNTSMVDAVKLASAVASRQSDSAVWVLSDGAFPSVAEQVETLPAEVRYISFGRRSDNAAITSLSVQPKAGAQSLFVQVANASGTATSRRLDVMVDDQPWNARTVNLPPMGTQELLLDDMPLAARVVHVRLAGFDALEADNQAWLVNRASVPANVLLVTSGNKFLELALSLLPTVTLYKVAPEAYDPAATIEGFPIDLTVFDSTTNTRTLQTLPQGSVLIFAPQYSNPIADVTGVITQPVPILSRVRGSDTMSPAEQMDGEPLLKFVELSSLHVATASQITLPTWGRQVLGSDRGPLIVAGEESGRKAAVVAFDVRDTDLPLQTAFPLLMRNMVTYLLPAPSGGLPAEVAPRSPVGIEAATVGVDKILVEDPNGKEWVYDVSDERPRISYAETGHPGVYYITQYADNSVVAQEAFAVNLFSREESLIAPNPNPGLPGGGAASVPAAAPAQANEIFKRELWPTVALAGFFLLLIEWLYAQRMAIRRAITEMQTRRTARGSNRAT